MVSIRLTYACGTRNSAATGVSNPTGSISVVTTANVARVSATTENHPRRAGGNEGDKQ
ncbi:hypothetical protein P4W15_06200 [Morganella morganii]|nr:hypothetical protein [Morganella morganii]